MSKTNPQFVIESDGVNNMGASFNSDPVYLGGRTRYSIQATTDAGTHVGTLSHEGSDDQETWVAIPLASGGTTVAVTNGANPEWLHNGSNAAYTYIRIAYTRTSGDGQLDAMVITKRG